MILKPEFLYQRPFGVNPFFFLSTSLSLRNVSHVAAFSGKWLFLSTAQTNTAKEEVEFGTESEDSSEELTDLDEVFQNTELKKVTKACF